MDKLKNPEDKDDFAADLDRMVTEYCASQTGLENLRAATVDSLPMRVVTERDSEGTDRLYLHLGSPEEGALNEGRLELGTWVDPVSAEDGWELVKYDASQK